MKYERKLSIFLISVFAACERNSYNQRILKGFDAIEACGCGILKPASLVIKQRSNRSKNKDQIAHGIAHVKMLKM